LYPRLVEGISTAKRIAVGGTHTCALLEDETVHCWGLNSSGQLGDGTTTNRNTPVSVIGFVTTDTTAPINPSILINGGADTTDNQTVTLTLSATDDTAVTHYLAKEEGSDPDSTESAWQAYTTSARYTFDNDSLESKSIYVWFKDEAGNVSAETSASIEYTSPAPPSAEWIQQLGSSSYDSGRSVATDNSGNIYITGYTSGGLAGNSNAGSNDLFLTKYSSSGVSQWTRQVGTTNYDAGWGVATDSSGNVYAVGSTLGAVDGNSNSGSTDLFVVKYSADGVEQWTKQMGGSQNDIPYSVATDSSRNVYISGNTEGTLNGTTQSGIGRNFFVVKLNDSGVEQWTQQMGASDDVDGWDMAVTEAGNVYITGSALGGVDGNAYNGGMDMYVVKFDTTGTKQWTKQLGNSNIAYSIALDSNENIYVTGLTDDDFDGNTNLGGDDVFVVKYDSSGNKQWSKQFGTSADENGEGIAVDNSGNVYITGPTAGSLDENTTAGGLDVFVIKLDSNGSKQWTQQVGTSEDDFGWDIDLDDNQNIYITGSSAGSIASDGSNNAGSHDVMLIKFPSAP